MNTPTGVTEQAVDMLIIRHCPTESWERALRRLHALRPRLSFAYWLSEADRMAVWHGREEGSIATLYVVVRDGEIRTVLPRGSERTGRQGKQTWAEQMAAEADQAPQA
jgi:hypothetical protein